MSDSAAESLNSEFHMPASVMDDAERLRLVAEIVAEMRPIIQADGGDIELIAIKGPRVEVRLTGACTTCALAGQTLGGIRRKLMKVLDTPVMVVPLLV